MKDKTKVSFSANCGEPFGTYWIYGLEIVKDGLTPGPAIYLDQGLGACPTYIGLRPGVKICMELADDKE